MTSIADVFKNQKKVLITYLMVGDPDPETSEKIIEEAALKADILELGVPFSDPIADGPVIQAAAFRALNHGVTVETLLKTVRNLRAKGIKTPIITMLYYNLVLQYGVEKFVESLSQAGLNGALIPDLPLEESENLSNLMQKKGLDFPMMVTPVTGKDRSDRICASATGFIYYVSYTGTTGSGAVLDYGKIAERVKEIRARFKTPAAVGFGIKDRNSAEKVWEFAQGAVVGSALIQKIQENLHHPDTLPLKVGELLKELKGNGF